MNKILKFRAEADDEDVFVTLDGTTYMVKYCRAHKQSGLKLFHSRGDANLLLSTTFRAKSWAGTRRE
jgi:hypothetical protein